MILCTGNHDWSMPNMKPGFRKPITLEDGSWVGARAMVCPGVTLGEGATQPLAALSTKIFRLTRFTPVTPRFFVQATRTASLEISFLRSLVALVPEPHSRL